MFLSKTVFWALKNGAKQLFDLASCNCEFSACCCNKSRRIPANEQTFLIDQVTFSTMVIVSVEVLATKRLKKKITREANPL